MARTNVDLDNHLMKEGMARFKCRTKKELLHVALRELLRRDHQRDILRLAGKIHWAGNLSAWRRDRTA